MQKQGRPGALGRGLRSSPWGPGSAPLLPHEAFIIWLLCQLLKGPQFPDALPSALPELQALNPDKLQHPFATSPWHLPSLTLTPDTSTISIFQVRKPLPSNGLSTP